ncbi:copper resistance protein B [Sphingosinithalassobacter tenebrarum]|uniref:Copper resistance protein B n=2 Tax=Stakelama tenebrarum TaxID=2711215 RepID=A0A6G6YAJ4_9SPHN|nr:copper resistance protein B [Sphingosinithalassobacter tenebrarum]
MKYLAALLLAGVATPALAQHAGHDMQVPPKAESPAEEDHSMPMQHGDPAMQDMPMMDHGASSQDPPVAGPPPAARTGPAHAADTVFDPQAMAVARAQTEQAMGAILTSKVLIDRVEYRARDGDDGYLWDGQAWYGGDIDKLWIKSEGEGSFGEPLEHGEAQALWSHALDPWFDLQIGVRQDFGVGPDRTHLAIGVQGLAPYWFEVDGALFVSNEGDVTARAEAEYDLRLTQKLILQPRAEVNLSAQDIPELGIGSGLSTAEAGLRLRYAIEPQFAPYVGVSWERSFGHTRDYARQQGEPSGGFAFTFGLRSWF